MEIKIKYKIWLEYNGKPLIGKGRYSLLIAIKKNSSLKKAALDIGIANKTAYNYIKHIETRLGKKVIQSHRGGKDAGGYTKLTATGEKLIKKFEEVDKRLK